MKTRLWIILACCWLWLAGCQADAEPPTGVTVQVQQVVNGQTIEVLIPSSQEPTLIKRIRLKGIAAPDLQQQPWGVAAKKRLEELLSQPKDTQLALQSVWLSDLTPKDRYGRYWAYVWRDSLINEQLVREGYVLAEVPSPLTQNDLRLVRAQEYARLMGYGIWNPDRPMRLTPQQFRTQPPFQ